MRAPVRQSDVGSENEQQDDVGADLEPDGQGKFHQESSAIGSTRLESLSPPEESDAPRPEPLHRGLVMTITAIGILPFASASNWVMQTRGRNLGPDLSS